MSFYDCNPVVIQSGTRGLRSSQTKSCFWQQTACVAHRLIYNKTLTFWSVLPCFFLNKHLLKYVRLLSEWRSSFIMKHKRLCLQGGFRFSFSLDLTQVWLVQSWWLTRSSAHHQTTKTEVWLGQSLTSAIGCCNIGSCSQWPYSTNKKLYNSLYKFKRFISLTWVYST